MAKKANYSLSSLKMGAVANDGTMGTSLTTFDDPVRDTCVLTMAPGNTQNFMSEISDYPYFTAITPGDITLKADFYAKTAAQLVSVFGGSATAESGGTPEMWNAPASQVTLEQSIELTHKNGKKMSLVRCSVTAQFEWNFKRSALPLIHLTATVLQPIDPTTGAPLAIAPLYFTGVVGS